MSKHIHDLSLLYVDNRERPYQVSMYTDEHSEVCRIEFGNSFTLTVVDPLTLESFIQDLQKFADAAHDFHYGIQAQRVDAIGEEMAQLQEKLESCGVVGGFEWTQINAQINAARARYLREEEVEEVATGFDPTTLPEVMEMMTVLESIRECPDDRTEPEPVAEPSKVERLMRGTISAPQMDPMNDPINW